MPQNVVKNNGAISLQLVEVNSWVWYQQRQSIQKLSRESKERDGRQQPGQNHCHALGDFVHTQGSNIKGGTLQRTWTSLTWLSGVTEQIRSQTPASFRGVGEGS